MLSRGESEHMKTSVGHVHARKPAGKSSSVIGQENAGSLKLKNFLANCANTRAPRLSTMVQDQLERGHPDEVTAYTAVWTRIWHILSSVCITRLWMRLIRRSCHFQNCMPAARATLALQRNRVTFQQEDVTIAGSVHEFWESGIRQLRAVAKREGRRIDT